MSTISTTVTQAVQLGTGGYTSPLTITGSGAIIPTALGPAALTAGAGLAGVSITNQGTITGAPATSYTGPTSRADAGLQILDAAIITNSGQISGGSAQSGLLGGVGILLGAGASLSNAGTVAGGNTAMFTGPPGLQFHGGAGIDASGAASITNTGLIHGGSGGQAGLGVSLTQSSALINHGEIDGGSNLVGGDGLDIGAGCTATNTGIIKGGYGDDAGGIGVAIASGGTLSNSGTIQGGADAGSFGSLPGSGVQVSGGTFVNSGVVIGSGQTDDDALGLNVSGGSVINTGQISGYFEGAEILDGSVLNTGTISAVDRTYGTGVSLIGGTLTTSGTITGAGGPSQQNGAGDAVYVTPRDQPAILIVEAGAKFNGLVEATPTGIAILEFGGSTDGTVGLLGTEYTGFDIIEVAAFAQWTLKQANTIAATTSLFVDGQLNVAGVLQDNGIVSIRRLGELTVASGGAVRAQAIALDGGILAGAASGKLAVGNNVAAAQAGAVTVDLTGTISGYGTITAPSGIIDNGVITATPGDFDTLFLNGAVSGSGILNIASGAGLSVNGNLTVAKLAFAGPGELLLTGGYSETTPIAGFGTGDMIYLHNTSATSLSYGNGTLSLFNGSTLVEQLDFAGAYTTANFALASSGPSNSTITFAATTPSVGHAARPDHGPGQPQTWQTASLSGHTHPL